jgi:transcriptional regulator with XRE-family HTH domain
MAVRKPGVPMRPASLRSDAEWQVCQRMRERRAELGVSQQQMGELIGVSYQQVHKYETGINRISASRLLAIAEALGVGVGYFFEGLARECAVEPNAQHRLLLELIRDFTAIPNRKVQEAFCAVARAVAAVEPEAENGARPARASRTRPKSATKAG